MRLLDANHASRPIELEAKRPKWRFGKPWQVAGLSLPARVAVAIAVFGFLLLAVVLWRQESPLPRGEESANSGLQETPTASPSANPARASTPEPAEEPDTFTQSLFASLRDNNREIRLDQKGNLTGVDELDESAKRMVKAALAGESLAKPKVLEDLSSQPIKLLGDPPGETTFELIGPFGRVITEERPTFKWRGLGGAASYVVSIFDDNFNRVARSPALSKTNWTAAMPLARGRTYSWEVTATKDGTEITAPVAPGSRAEFRILEAEKLSELTRLKQQQRVSHLALGLMHARFGLVTEAEGEFRQLVKENPNSVQARKLLRTVQQWQTR